MPDVGPAGPRTFGVLGTPLVSGARGWNTPAADRYAVEHLYGLEADPDELHDLVDSPEHRDVPARLRARLVERSWRRARHGR